MPIAARPPRTAGATRAGASSRRSRARSSASPRRASPVPAAAHQGAVATTTVMHTIAAGCSRRSRRRQKCRSPSPRCVSISASNNDVMRKPDSVKNASTPSQPPPRRDRWKATTAATASPRSPSSRDFGSPPTSGYCSIRAHGVARAFAGSVVLVVLVVLSGSAVSVADVDHFQCGGIATSPS